MTIKADVKRLWGNKTVRRVMVAGSFVAVVAVAIIIYSTFELLSPVQSYPLVGGIWQADFNAMSTNLTDLTISFVKPTTKTELEMVGLYCNGNLVPFYGRSSGITWEGGTTSSYYYKWYNYKCDGITSWKVKVLKPGSHQQRIQFGNIKQDIFNDAFLRMTLLESRCGVIECTAKLQFNTPIEVRIPTAQNKDYNVHLNITKGELKSISYQIGRVTETQKPDYKEYCTSKTIIIDDNFGHEIEEKTQVCQTVEDWNTPIIEYSTSWRNRLFGETLTPDANYIIEIRAQRNPPYLQQFEADWILTFAGHEYKEYAWWNASWLSKRQIIIPNNNDINKGGTIILKTDCSALTVQTDLDDARVVDENHGVEIGRFVMGLGTSDDCNIGFLTNNPIKAGQTDVNYYYLYYNNAAATYPTDWNAGLTQLCDAETDACQYTGTVPDRNTTVKRYGNYSLSMANGSPTRPISPLGSYADFNYGQWVYSQDATLTSGMDLMVWPNDICYAGIINDGMFYYAGATQTQFGSSANNTWYYVSTRYINGDQNCYYTWFDSGMNWIASQTGRYRQAAGTPTHIALIFASGSTGPHTFIDNFYLEPPKHFAIGLGNAEGGVSDDNSSPTITWMQPGNNAWKSGRFYLNFVVTDDNAVKTGWIDSNVGCFKNTVDVIYEDFDDKNSASRWDVSGSNDTNGYLWKNTSGFTTADENFLALDFNLHIKLRSDTTTFASQTRFFNNTPTGIGSNAYWLTTTPDDTEVFLLWTAINGTSSVVCDAIGDANTGSWLTLDINRIGNTMIVSAENGLYSCSATNQDHNRNYVLMAQIATAAGIDDLIIEAADFNIFDGDYNLMSWDSAGLGCGSVYDANITVHAVDWNAQNGIAQSSRIIKIDNSPPTTLNDANNVWQTGDANVNFKCSDLGSGCKRFFYTVSDINYSKGWGDANIGIPITTDGNTLITFWSSDQTDSNEATKYAYVAIDKTNPLVIITLPQDGNQAYASNTVTFDLNDVGGINIATLHADINGVSSTDINWPTQCTKIDTNFRCTYTETKFNVNNRDYNLTVYADDNSGRHGRHTHVFKWKASPTILWGNLNEYYQSDVNHIIDLYLHSMTDHNVTPRKQNDLNGIFNIWNQTVGSLDVNVFVDLNATLPNDSNAVACKQNKRVAIDMIKCFDINSSSEALVITKLAYDANQMLWWFFDLNIIGPYPGMELVIDYQYRAVIA